MNKTYQERKKWAFYPKEWEFQDHLAVGVNLLDAKYRNEPVWEFHIKGEVWKVPREVATHWARKYHLPFGSNPDLIPRAVMEKEENKQRVETRQEIRQKVWRLSHYSR